MSGIYIPGMEMPENCFECYWRCKVDPENLLCRISGEYFEETFSTIKGRHKSCPLVPVPPHGRLIDADALEQDAQKRMLICNKNDNQFQKPYEVMRAIALAPAIITAEEGKT